jgi:hypothetical protein
VWVQADCGAALGSYGSGGHRVTGWKQQLLLSGAQAPTGSASL